MSSVRNRMKQLVPTQVSDRIKGGLVDYGVRTSDRRPLPDFLIIGTKRGGTTSLWNYLIQHPLVPRLFPAWNTKATHYFEENWHRGEAWYRSHFPTTRQRAALENRHGGPARAGEAAPLYMFHPLAAQRVAALMPGVRLIVLLRDPVERAYSHWKERRTNGVEPLGFAEALAAEPERTAGERERLIAEPEYFSEAYDWYTYRARGRYLEHLEPWLERFDRSQILFVPSEQLYRDARGTYRRTLDFLGLPPHDLGDFKVYNDRRSAPLDPALRAELTGYYRPYNAALRQRLDLDLDWPDGVA
ncbi:sulfotransferase domain-containing protein [Micromonospora mirobrigensis]|uniref:Sulfotransferase domain-containing protein n=1 Tax=Micromonospora mirobrigensis TaxID=262898 RepID=A0A1C4ZFV8_9ACTN|nr:sulfotransferase domain-containing protein [Micromonospora mirobrigensis]SCF31883.1 Sulfotransferase domain-containing protein [Micromonospora mirobrigensis]